MMDCEMFIERATKAYRLCCNKMGGEPQQPCRYSSDVKDDARAIMVVLRNVNGTLATYQYDADQDRLQWIDPESLPKPKSYEVVFEDFDTRIREYDDEHECETFEDAKETALGYLQNLIEGCQATFDKIDQARTFEEYQQS